MDELLELDPPWLAPAPEQSLATQTGALAFTGALADAEPDALALPTWTVPTDSSELCPAWLWPDDVAVEALLDPPDCFAPVPPDVPATVTGAFAFTGAWTATAGLASALPTCTVTAEWSAFWSVELEPEEAPELALAAPTDWEAVLPLVFEATLTGAFALTGADAATAGFTAADPTWAVPTEPVAACGLPTSARAVPVPVPSAINAAPRAQRRFMVVSFRSNDFRSPPVGGEVGPGAA